MVYVFRFIIFISFLGAFLQICTAQRLSENYIIAEKYFIEGNYPAANIAIDNAIREDSTNLENYFLKAYIVGFYRDYGESINVLRGKHIYDTTNWQVHYEMGNFYTDYGFADSAIMYYTLAKSKTKIDTNVRAINSEIA